MLLFYSSVDAVNYYVSPKGDDLYEGTDTTQPLKTIQSAADRTNPGDTVYIMQGTYRNNAKEWHLIIKKSGLENAWIVFKAFPGYRPKLLCNGLGGIDGNAISYIEINGLELIGFRDSIDLEYAETHEGSPECYNVGIHIVGNSQQITHHIRIVNNIIGKFCGTGIGCNRSDYMTLDNNIVYGNAWYNNNANSGIAFYQNRGIDSITDYKIFITRNICYNNRSLVVWSTTGRLSDGNGIIVDDTKNTQGSATSGIYPGRTLIAHNISYNNGGTGMHAYASAHVDMINNTLYMNSQIVDYPSVSAYLCSDVRIYNNIVYADSGKRLNRLSSTDTNVIFDHNIYFGGRSSQAVRGPNDTIIDPKFISPSTDPVKADFRPGAGSHAYCNGMEFSTIGTDIVGKLKTDKYCNDIGAYKVSNDAMMIKSMFPRNLRILMNFK